MQTSEAGKADFGVDMKMADKWHQSKIQLLDGIARTQTHRCCAG